MKNGWYYKAAQNDIALAKEAINWKDIRKGLGWGIGLGTIPFATNFMTAPNKSQTEQSQKPAITQQLPSNIQEEQKTTSTPNISQFNTQPQSTYDIDKIMNVIHQLESSGGINTKARFEPEFLKNYGNKGLMPILRKRYGDKAAASSYGPYQVMLLKAWEMGFKISPEELANPEINKKVAESIVKNYLNKGYKPWQIFKRYNGGSEYADKAMNLLKKYK